MDLPATLAVMAALAATAVFSGWRGARPPDFAKGPRLVPWRAIMALSAVALLVLLVHLINLLGVETGRR